MSPSGYWWCRPMVCATRSAGSRLISRIERAPLQQEAVLALHRHPEFGRPHVVEPEALVEQPDERPDRAGGVVVLGLAEQQRRAPLDVAQVHVVAEARAAMRPRLSTASTTSGSGLFHFETGCSPTTGAPAHRRHRLALGEDLGVRADPHLEVLAPEPLAPAAPPWRPPPPRSRVRCRARRPRSARRCARGPPRPSPGPGRALLDHPLDHRAGEGHPAGLERLQVAWREQPRPPSSPARVAAAISASAPSGRPARRAHPSGRVVELQDVADGRRLARGELDHAPLAHGHHPGPSRRAPRRGRPRRRPGPRDAAAVRSTAPLPSSSGLRRPGGQIAMPAPGPQPRPTPLSRSGLPSSL